MDEQEKLPLAVAPPADPPAPEVTEPEETTAPVTEPTPPPPPAQPDMTQVAQVFADTMRQPFADLAQALRPPPAAPPLPDDVPDDEIDRAILNGERPAAIVKRAIRAEVAKARAELQSELATARGQVTQTLEQLSRQTIAGSKHYDRLRPEIDKRLATLPADARANPEVVRHVYNIVRGEQADALEAEAVEAARRQARATTAAPTPGSGSPRPGAAVATQNPREFFSDEEWKAVEMGGGLEGTARRLGYKSTEAYLQKRIAQRNLQ